jgi:hypothetical protein
MKYSFLKPAESPDAIQQLVRQFGSEAKLIRAAVNATYFVHPDKVTAASHYPLHARHSRAKYPNKTKGETVEVNGVTITLDFNHKAQATWKSVTGVFKRKSGYGVRHIWGNASDPDAYTATWNICYMPFWAGMMTEDQHPLQTLATVIQQISFNAYFRKGPLSKRGRPKFVVDPGLDLERELPEDTTIHFV